MKWHLTDYWYHLMQLSEIELAELLEKENVGSREELIDKWEQQNKELGENE